MKPEMGKEVEVEKKPKKPEKLILVGHPEFAENIDQCKT